MTADELEAVMTGVFHEIRRQERIHRAAMDKMRAGLRREDGKILKPPGFRPPDMTAAVARAEARR